MYFKDFVFHFVMHIEMIQIKRSFIVVWKNVIDPSHMEYSQVVEIDITVQVSGLCAEKKGCIICVIYVVNKAMEETRRFYVNKRMMERIGRIKVMIFVLANHIFSLFNTPEHCRLHLSFFFSFFLHFFFFFILMASTHNLFFFLICIYGLPRLRLPIFRSK